MRFELAFFKQAEELGARVAQQLRLARLVRSPVEANHIDVLYQQDVRGGLRNAAGSKADNKDAPAPGNRAQAGIERIAAHGIVDDVRSASAGDRLHALANVLA